VRASHAIDSAKELRIRHPRAIFKRAIERGNPLLAEWRRAVKPAARVTRESCFGTA
jgi:hypothetical protein